MKKRILSMILAATMVFALALTGCGSNDSGNSDSGSGSDGGSEEKAESNGKKVGVAMPTQSSERWIKDGENMKKQLEALGYEVDLQYAEDDIQAQTSQLETMIAQQVDCLVIASIDSEALVNVLDQAKEANIPVIAYDRLLMSTDAVSYYASFDNEGVGRKIGEYIEEKAGLASATEPQTIEFFMGSPDDNNAVLLHKGVMSVLQKYLDNGTLVCKSGRTSFEDTCILRWSQETAQQNCENFLTGFYAEDDLDIACSAFDGFAYGIKAALEGAGYKVGTKWPLITGQDAEVMAVKNIIEGSQTQTIFKDTGLLAEKCVTMVQAVLEGTEPEINDTETYDNGVKVVPSYLCEPVSLDKDNYKELVIESGYYTEADIENAE
ncbi:MAG: sugar ABC transporter substrate-binding protein [Coprococcus sp.]|nr:sugar ABC transporter substrate-binding protein [Coprococcus sp.]